MVSRQYLARNDTSSIACAQPIIIFDFLFRHLEKKAAEEKEKERQERRRKERKHRDAFVELLQRHVSEGVLVARMRWKVCLTHAFKAT